MGSCRARSVYLTTRLLGRLSDISVYSIFITKLNVLPVSPSQLFPSNTDICVAKSTLLSITVTPSEETLVCL